MKMKTSSVAVHECIKYIICIILTGIIVYSISYYVNINFDYSYIYISINICKDLITTILNPGYGWFGCLLKCIGNVIFYVILSLGAKFILNNIKFVFLSILAFIFSYALLKDFYSKHFYKKWKGNILEFMIKLLECKRFLIFYLIFLLLSFVFRNIIRSGVLFLLEKDDILCYTLVVLLSITIIIYISNILWKVLNSLLLIFSNWIFSASRPKDGASSCSSATEINKENITAEDFSLFNKKVTNNVTIYNCVYIIFIIYINQTFPGLYFMIIVCCFIILLIIFLLFSIKKNNLVVFSPAAQAKVKACPPGMNHTLKSAIPLNSVTIVGIIGASLSTAHIGLGDAIDSTGWRFGDGKYDKMAAQQKVYNVNNTKFEDILHEGTRRKARMWHDNAIKEIKKCDSQILRVVHCYEEQTRSLGEALDAARLEYKLKSIRVDGNKKWILGNISSSLPNTNIYVLSLFLSDDPEFSIRENNIYFPSYYITGPEKDRLSYISKSIYKAGISRQNTYDGGIVIMPGRPINNPLNMIQIPRITTVFRTDAIRLDMSSLQLNIDSMRERNDNGPQHEGERMDSIFNNEGGMFNIENNNAFINYNIMNNYLIPLLEKLGDGNMGPLDLMHIVNSGYDEYHTLEFKGEINPKGENSSIYSSDHYIKGGSVYKVLFNIGEFNLSGNNRGVNLKGTEYLLTEKRQALLKACNEEVNQADLAIYGVNIVNNWMEFLKVVNINGNQQLFNIAFLDQNYSADFPNYTINNTSTIYNILNSDSQLKRFFEFIRLKHVDNNQYIFLTGDKEWNNVDITRAPRYNIGISYTN